MQQPKSIERFEQLFFLSMVVWIVIVILSIGNGAGPPANSPISPETAKMLSIGYIVVVGGIWALLWYLTARRGSDAAKWFYVVLIALDVVANIASMLLLKLLQGRPDVELPKVDLTTQLGQIAALIVGVVSIWFLFQADTRTWFNKGVDPTV